MRSGNFVVQLRFRSLIGVNEKRKENNDRQGVE